MQHGLVGRLDEFVLAGAVIGEKRAANTDAESHRLPLNLDHLGQRTADALGQLAAVLLALDAAEDDYELVATHSHGKVVTTHRRVQAPTDLLQDKVTDVVPQFIVDRLEAVEVHEQHAQLGLLAGGARNLLRQVVFESAPVGQTGERVAVCQLVVGPALVVNLLLVSQQAGHRSGNEEHQVSAQHQIDRAVGLAENIGADETRRDGRVEVRIRVGVKQVGRQHRNQRGVDDQAAVEAQRGEKQHHRVEQQRRRRYRHQRRVEDRIEGVVGGQCHDVDGDRHIANPVVLAFAQNEPAQRGVINQCRGGHQHAVQPDDASLNEINGGSENQDQSVQNPAENPGRPFAADGLLLQQNLVDIHECRTALPHPAPGSGHAGVMRLLIGPITRSDHRTTGCTRKPHLQRFFLEHLEGVGMHVAGDRQVVP